ncbi:MAG: prepilin-type N-terminal cleavage/methylation domain-containing protein [Candidatus Zixiibacteriota bacterium]
MNLSLNSVSKSIRGFTLIEVVIIIVVLGILSTFAIAKYQDLTLDAKKSACRSSLGGLRSGINTWYSQNIVKNAQAAFPPIDTLRGIGKVMEHRIPPNPFQTNAPDSIVAGVTKGVVVGTRGGWAYSAATGEIWANTNTIIEAGSGCSGEDTTVGESSW